MGNIKNMQQVAEILEELGYEVKWRDQAVYTAIGGTSDPFIAVITKNDNEELVITCRVAKLGDYHEDEIPTMQFSLLDANTRIRPFAFGVLTATDDPESYDDVEDYPIILTDSMPLGDLSSEELGKAMDSLLVALEIGSDALKVGLK